jgi:hypothetical protein
VGVIFFSISIIFLSDMGAQSGHAIWAAVHHSLGECKWGAGKLPHTLIMEEGHSWGTARNKGPNLQVKGTGGGRDLPYLKSGSRARDLGEHDCRESSCDSPRPISCM